MWRMCSAMKGMSSRWKEERKESDQPDGCTLRYNDRTITTNHHHHHKRSTRTHPLQNNYDTTTMERMNIKRENHNVHTEVPFTWCCVCTLPPVCKLVFLLKIWESYDEMDVLPITTITNILWEFSLSCTLFFGTHLVRSSRLDFFLKACHSYKLNLINNFKFE